MKVALIGSNGQLGQDILKIFRQKKDLKVIPLTHKDIEVTDPNSVKKILSKYNPEVLINTAAYHKVDEAENYAEKAFLVNAIAPKNIAELTAKKGIKIVFISTDYVFGLDEKRKKPYTETDTTGAVNVYGVSKIAGENFTLYSNPQHFVVRVSGLHGTAGSSGKGGNFVETMIRLGKEKGEVSVVNDQFLTPTYTLNIAENLLDLITTDKFGIYHMTAEGYCSWYEFTCEIFHLLNMQVKVNPIDSSQFPTRSIRPKYSVLENRNLKVNGLNRMNHWKENLKRYLIEKGYLVGSS